MQEDCRMQCEKCGEWQYPDALEIYGDHAACIGYCNMAYLQSLPEEYYDEFIAKVMRMNFGRNMRDIANMMTKPISAIGKKMMGLRIL